MCTTHMSQLSFQHSGGGGGSGGSGSSSGAQTMQETLKSKTKDGSEENATCQNTLFQKKKSLEAKV